MKKRIITYKIEQNNLMRSFGLIRLTVFFYIPKISEFALKLSATFPKSWFK